MSNRIQNFDDVEEELDEVKKRLVVLDDPDHGKIAIVGRKIEAGRKGQRYLRNGIVGVVALVAVLAITGLILREQSEDRIAALDKAAGQHIADVKNDLDVVAARVATAEKAIVSNRDRIDHLGRRVVGVRDLLDETIARTGSVEDDRGIDHNRKLIRISGFPVCKLAGETLVMPKLTSEMKKELAKLPAILAKDGYDLKRDMKEIFGFADETPFRQNGKILPNSDQLNLDCADARAKVLRAYLEISYAVPAEGRGRTEKFGELYRNRSGLLYLERSAS